MRDVGTYLLALLRHFTGWVTSSVLAGVLAIYEHWRHDTVSWYGYGWVLVAGVFISSYQAWREPFRKNKRQIEMVVFENKFLTNQGVKSYYHVGIDIGYSAIGFNAIKKWSLQHPNKERCAHYRIPEIAIREGQAGVRDAWGIGILPLGEAVLPDQVIDLPAEKVLIRKRVFLVGDANAGPGSCEVSLVVEDAFREDWRTEPFVPGGQLVHTAL
jgi:hypothetical protein